MNVRIESKFAPILCALAFLATATAGKADIPAAAPAAQPAASPLSIASVSYPLLRVGDLAPQWAFTTKEGKSLDSHNFLGQSAQLIFVESVPPTVLPLAEKPIADQIGKLWQTGTAVVSASPNPATVQGLDDKTGVLQLRDSDRLLQVLLGEGNLVSIDRCGFIRDMTPLAELPTDDPALFAAALASRGDAPLKLEIGSPAPDFSLPDMHGHIRRVSDLHGRKNLLLTFFPKCFTGGCANHLTSLQESLPVFTGNDTEIWAVSIDPAQGEQGQIAFAKKLGVQFPLIPDVGRNLSFLYGAASNPTERAARMSVLIDKTGIVRAIDRTVKVATHGPDMLNQMTALGMLKTEAPK